MAAQWNYKKDGEECGPVSSQELKQLVAQGDLTSADLISREGSGRWLEARQIKGLFKESTIPTTEAKQSSVPTPVAALAESERPAGTDDSPASSPGASEEPSAEAEEQPKAGTPPEELSAEPEEKSGGEDESSSEEDGD